MGKNPTKSKSTIHAHMALPPGIAKIQGLYQGILFGSDIASGFCYWAVLYVEGWDLWTFLALWRLVPDYMRGQNGKECSLYLTMRGRIERDARLVLDYERTGGEGMLPGPWLWEDRRGRDPVSYLTLGRQEEKREEKGIVHDTWLAEDMVETRLQGGKVCDTWTREDRKYYSTMDDIGLY